MTTIRNVVAQEMIEKRYSRKHIDGYIRQAIEENPDMQAKINQGEQMLIKHIGTSYFASKDARLAQLAGMDMRELVTDLFVGVAYCLKPELFTSVTAKLASRLQFSDKPSAILTVAEIMAILCLTDAFDINKADKMSSLVVQSCIPLSDTLLEYIEHSQYLPPMVCQPLELRSNFDSGYLTHNDSLILGNGNHHDGDICIDVLNTMNKVQLRLDNKFLSTHEEDVNTEITLDSVRNAAAQKGKILNDAEVKEQVIKQKEQWSAFKEQSYVFYSLIANHQEPFYLTNKVDKRGRIYSQGYHINTQGTSFKKASINLAHEELVTGVPQQ